LPALWIAAGKVSMRGLDYPALPQWMTGQKRSNQNYTINF